MRKVTAAPPRIQGVPGVPGATTDSGVPAAMGVQMYPEGSLQTQTRDRECQWIQGWSGFKLSLSEPSAQGIQGLLQI